MPVAPPLVARSRSSSAVNGVVAMRFPNRPKPRNRLRSLTIFAEVHNCSLRKPRPTRGAPVTGASCLAHADPSEILLKMIRLESGARCLDLGVRGGHGRLHRRESHRGEGFTIDAGRIEAEANSRSVRESLAMLDEKTCGASPPMPRPRPVGGARTPGPFESTYGRSTYQSGRI